MIIGAGFIAIILAIQGFGFIMSNEIRIYLELGKEVPNRDRIVKLGIRNFKLSGSQSVFQIMLCGLIL